MVNEYIDPREWTVYPPEEDAGRLKRYEECRALLMGDHSDVFCHDGLRLHKPKSELSKVLNAVYDAMEGANVIYVASNYCKVASQLFANMLFGTPPKAHVEEDGGQRQKRITKIMENNMLDMVNHQQAVEASCLGDAYYRVRWGKMANWREEGVIIEPLVADNVWPILNPGNIKDNQGYCVTNTVEVDGKKYLYRETHLPWRITYALHELDGGKIGAQVPLDIVDTYAELWALGGQPGYSWDGDTLQYETGYPGLLVEHVPNWTKPELFFGISDYTPDVVSNQAAINEMQTGILRTCLKHMDPKLALPEGTLEQDREGRWFIRRSDMEVIEVPGEVAAALPKYITWDAKLEAATANINACFDAMMLSLGISPAIFGLGKYGMADSGTALKLRMTQTLWLVGQKRMYFDAALKNILYAAQFLDGRFGPESYEPLDVSITWPDPLPQDLEAQSEAMSKLVTNGLYSRETAIAQVQSLEGEALQSEVDRVNNDRIGTWITTVGLPLLTSGTVSNEQFVALFNAQTALDVDIVAQEEPEGFPEEE